MITPVAFIIFNRPQNTARVWERIRAARPARLLLIADGPRATHPTDRQRCVASRAIVDAVDWPCEVSRNFAENNLGCGKRVSSGIDWVFSLVPEAIILEDDCVPDVSFFNFCQNLLERYRDDPRVMHIGGSNFQRGVSRTPYSYYFSKYTHIWGWATWRRAWRLYDFGLKQWPEFKESGLLRGFCPNPLESALWMRMLDQVAAGSLDTWDLQWMLACWTNHGLSILPDVNLISNIGIGADATHTFGGGSDAKLADLAAGQMNLIRHPPFIAANADADEFTLNTVYEIPNPSSDIGLRQIAVALRKRLRNGILSG